MPYDEKTSILFHGEQRNRFPQPLSFTWRVLHNIAYLIGGTTFVFGSYQYFPWVNGYVTGGWLFTIGSASFLCADLGEWWKNNRVGCFYDSEYQDDFESQVCSYMKPKSTLLGRFQRAENGLNFAYSAVGSFLYLVGSIFFIPSTNELYLGTITFIVGSLVIFTSQLWKVYRSGCFNLTDPRDSTFRISNINDWPAYWVDSLAGLGGLAYTIGSIYFLPSIDVSDHITYIAACWFIIGGVSFTASGIAIVYRYFFTENYPH